MINMLSVREIQQEDIDLIIAYWLESDRAFMEGMGVDMDKMPSRKEWNDMLQAQLRTPFDKKKSYAMIWLYDNKPIGHCNINKIVWQQEAHMHLHLWNKDVRQQGMGTELVNMTVPHFFEKFGLKTLYCEPYALNPAPNKTLAKAGFELVRTYTTIPGMLHFEQQVNLWQISLEKQTL